MKKLMLVTALGLITGLSFNAFADTTDAHSGANTGVDVTAVSDAHSINQRDNDHFPQSEFDVADTAGAHSGTNTGTWMDEGQDSMADTSDAQTGSRTGTV